jgi:hypothetical protein
MGSRSLPAEPATKNGGQVNTLQRQTFVGISAIAVVAGVLAFGVGLTDGGAVRAWQAFLVNLLFFLGIAQGGVVVSASFYLTQARWGGAGLYRLAESFAGFLPLGFLLFWVLLAGRALIFPWVNHPLPEKAAWLNVRFLFIRDGLGLLVMTLLSFFFIRASQRSDAVEWAQSYSNIDRPPSSVMRLSPILLIAYAAIYSMLAFDLVMSLSPRWYSTLFGAYFFAGAYWSALATIALLAIFLRRTQAQEHSAPHQNLLHDAGKLVFAFSVFWVYLFWSQYLPIWYADIPHESFFVVVRVHAMPWRPLSLAVVILVWLVPFVFLIGRKPKQTPMILGPVCVLGLIGFWLERYVLVAPSQTPKAVPFGWIEAAITVGFLGLFALTTWPRLALVEDLHEPGEGHGQ